MTNTIVNTINSHLEMITPSQKTQEKSPLPSPMISTISGGLFGLGSLAYSIQSSSTLSNLVATKLLSIHPEQHQKIILDYLWKSSSHSGLMALGLFTLSTTAFFTPAILKKIEEIKNQNFGHSAESVEQKDSETQPQVTEFISGYAKNLFSITLGLSFIDQLACAVSDVGYAAKSYLYSEYNTCQAYTSATKTNLLAAALILAAASTPFLAGKVKDYLNKQEEQTK